MADIDATPTGQAPDAPEQGQVAPEAPEQGQPQGPFLTFGEGDGRVEYRSKEDAIKSIGDLHKSYNTLRGDFSRRTAEWSEKEKAIASREEQLTKMLGDVESRAKEYKDFQSFVDRRPDVYKRWKAEISTPQSPDEMQGWIQKQIEEALSPVQEKLSAAEEYQKQQQYERQLAEAFTGVSGRVQGFDEQAVKNLMEELASGDVEKLAEVLHYSLVGQKGPVELEQQVARNVETKAKAALSSPQGGKKPPEKTAKDFGEITSRLIAQGN